MWAPGGAFSGRRIANGGTKSAWVGLTGTLEAPDLAHWTLCYNQFGKKGKNFFWAAQAGASYFRAEPLMLAWDGIVYLCMEACAMTFGKSFFVKIRGLGGSVQLRNQNPDSPAATPTFHH